MFLQCVNAKHGYYFLLTYTYQDDQDCGICNLRRLMLRASINSMGIICSVVSKYKNIVKSYNVFVFWNVVFCLPFAQHGKTALMNARECGKDQCVKIIEEFMSMDYLFCIIYILHIHFIQTLHGFLLQPCFMM